MLEFLTKMLNAQEVLVQISFFKPKLMENK